MHSYKIDQFDENMMKVSLAKSSKLKSFHVKTISQMSHFDFQRVKNDFTKLSILPCFSDEVLNPFWSIFSRETLQVNSDLHKFHFPASA